MRVVTFGIRGHPLTETAVAVISELGLEHIDHIDASDSRRQPPPADLYLSAAFTRILPPETLERAKVRLNVHPSLLPAYAGSHPVYWALYEGCTETGVTIHEMIPDVDAGAVVAQEALQIDPFDRPGPVYDDLTKLAGSMLTRVLTKLQDTGQLDSRPQSGEMTFRGPPYREIDRLALDWSKPAHEICRRVSIFPGWVNFSHAGSRVFVRRANVRGTHAGRPGEVLKKRRRYWVVVAGDGMTVRVWLRDVSPHRLRAIAGRVLRRLRSRSMAIRFSPRPRLMDVPTRRPPVRPPGSR